MNIVSYQTTLYKLFIYFQIKPSLLKLIGGYGDGGLTATIDIYSAVGGHVAVAFTERARPEKGCYAEDFGSFLNP